MATLVAGPAVGRHWMDPLLQVVVPLMVGLLTAGGALAGVRMNGRVSDRATEQRETQGRREEWSKRFYEVLAYVIAELTRTAPDPIPDTAVSATGTADSVPRIPESHVLPDAQAHDLTVREQQVLAVIADAVDRHGYPPSVREIGKGVGLTSTSSVSRVLKALERKGYLRRNSSLPRSVGIPVSEVDSPPAQ